MSVIAEAPPTEDQEAALEQLIVEQIGAEVHNFVVAVRSARSRVRRTRRSLLEVTWEVSFTVSASLADTGDSSSDSFAESVAETLTSNEFATAMSNTGGLEGATVDEESVQTVVEEREASSVDDEIEDHKKKKTTSAASASAQVLFVAVFGILFVGLGVYCLVRRRRKQLLRDGESVGLEAHSSEVS